MIDLLSSDGPLNTICVITRNTHYHWPRKTLDGCSFNFHRISFACRHRRCRRRRCCVQMVYKTSLTQSGSAGSGRVQKYLRRHRNHDADDASCPPPLPYVHAGYISLQLRRAPELRVTQLAFTNIDA